MNVIGIESSCDETSVAVISDGKLLANYVSSQEFHTNFGGVVPELSSRAHLKMVNSLFEKALTNSNITRDDIDVIAATAGPGLIGALLVGFTFAKGLAFSLNKPFVPVNHIEGHIYSPLLMENPPQFPYLSLVVSGGHTLLLIVKSETEIVKLGSTIDDAAGEAFDKVSKMIGLGYPGGPLIQQYAEKGDERKIPFPIAQTKKEYGYSFSGLKTAVLRYLQKEYEDINNIPENDLPDIAASFQFAAVKALTRNVIKALKNYDVKAISLAGGVAANQRLRDEMSDIAHRYRKQIVVPDMKYCGDNAAMIALRGMQVYNAGKTAPLNFTAFPSIPEDTFISP